MCVVESVFCNGDVSNNHGIPSRGCEDPDCVDVSPDCVAWDLPHRMLVAVSVNCGSRVAKVGWSDDGECRSCVVSETEFGYGDVSSVSVSALWMCGDDSCVWVPTECHPVLVLVSVDVSSTVTDTEECSGNCWVVDEHRLWSCWEPFDLVVVVS